MFAAIQEGTGPLTLGSIFATVGLVIVIVVSLVCLVIGIKERRDRKAKGRKPNNFTVEGSILVIIGVLALYFWQMWPLKYDYHHWIGTTGQVAGVSKRLVTTGSGDSRSINEKYVIRFEDGRIRALNDTIGGILQKGDEATLRCKKAWEWGVPQEANGWDCKWAGKRS